MMKESKFVRTKIVVSYVLIALIGLTAMIYVWRQTGALLEPDHSQQELRRRRGLVNQTLYHLYEAETYGQMLVAGYASYENRYKRELRLVRECIDSLRMRADDESQQMRLDTIVRLIAGKEQGIKALDRNLRSAVLLSFLLTLFYFVLRWLIFYAFTVSAQDNLTYLLHYAFPSVIYTNVFIFPFYFLYKKLG